MKLLAPLLLLAPLAACVEVDVRDPATPAPAATTAMTAPVRTSGAPGLRAGENAPTQSIVSNGGCPAASGQSADRAFASYRAAKGLPALKRSPALEAAAQAHARDVARLQTVTHVGSDGSKVGQRAREAGYRMRHVHENVGWTPCGFDFVLQSWTGSPSHLETMIRTDVSDYGIGRSGEYWVLITGQQG
ncbi:CAP domain-containing protein [Salipiger sp.]|uniref:CAP domain-containing protein n=1 Tax=Salipiger sp. TaxID=2078585 RepID=UPI003A976124